MNQENKSDAQVTAEFILSLSPHSQYEVVPDLPIPTQNGLVIRHLDKPKIISNLIDLEGGGKQEIFEATGNNTQDTCEGIIMAIGPNCSPYMRVGLKCQYSALVADKATRFRHRMKEYLTMDEYSVLFIIPDESTVVNNGIKDPRQIRREKSMYKNQKTLDNVYKDEQYKKDKANDKTKGKIFTVKK